MKDTKDSRDALAAAYKGAEKLIENNGVGWIMRAFAPRPADVPHRTQLVIETIKILQGISLHPRSRTAKVIDIWIPLDKSRKDHDCGLLRAAIITAIKNEALKDVFVHELHDGDIYCRMMNLAVARQAINGCRYSGFLATEARGNITADSLAQMYNALQQGAWVTGLAFGAIKEFTLSGYITTTCSIWKIATLQEFGGFDLMAEQRRITDPKRRSIMVQSEGEDYAYDGGGAEHIPPLLRMAEAAQHRKDKKPFIAPILGEDGWETPDPVTARPHYLRFKNMLGTKWARMLTWAEVLDLPIELITECVMPQYRQT